MVQKKKAVSKSARPPETNSNQKLIEIGAIAAAGIPLTTEQAAAYLQCTAGYLAILRCAGKGPAYTMLGTRPRYLKADLDSYTASCKTKRRVSPNVGRPPLGRKAAAR